MIRPETNNTRCMYFLRQPALRSETPYTPYICPPRVDAYAWFSFSVAMFFTDNASPVSEEHKQGQTMKLITLICMHMHPPVHMHIRIWFSYFFAMVARESAHANCNGHASDATTCRSARCTLTASDFPTRSCICEPRSLLKSARDGCQVRAAYPRVRADHQ